MHDREEVCLYIEIRINCGFDLLYYRLKRLCFILHNYNTTTTLAECRRRGRPQKRCQYLDVLQRINMKADYEGDFNFSYGSQ